MANKLFNLIRSMGENFGEKFAVAIIAISILTSGAQAQGKKSPSRARTQSDKTRLADNIQEARAELIKATNDYKQSLEKLIAMYESSLKDVSERAAKQKELFAQGIISKRELEEGEKKIAEAQAKVSESRKQIAEADDLIAESSIIEQPEVAAPKYASKYTSTNAYIRYNGVSRWTLSDSAKVGSFFLSKFGRSLPVSAYGQSATHDRLGFDHRNSVDVAVHPDSAEGQTLMTYLKSAGIPFIAFRRAVSGSATGAHIHIGQPSHRITVSASGR
jgi:Outer membrane efflux protein